MVFLALTSEGQVNLVQNPSFEDTVYCPGNVGQIAASPPWASIAGSSDYYHTCGYNGFGVPGNSRGYQLAFTGGGYAGISLWALHLSNGREFLGVPLTSELDSGYRYIVKCNVSLADSFQYAVSNFGFYFSEGVPPDDDQFLLQLQPQVELDTGEYMDDKVGWMEVGGMFIAEGNEEFLTIGNFDSDNEIDTLYVGDANDFSVAHYYVDSVSVLLDTTYHVGVEDPASSGLSLWPNPAGEWLVVNVSSHQQGEMVMFDASGRPVLSQQITSDRLYLEVSILDSGIYTVSLHSDEGVLRKKALIQR